MAVDFVCGFECRVLVSGAAVTPDEDHWDSTAAAGASISTATVRSGTASLRNLNPAAGCNINKTIARKTVAGRVYVRFATLPSATTVIVNVGGTNRGDIRVTSGGQVEVGWSTGTYVSVGSPLSTGVWYRLDFLADTTTGTASMKCRIDLGTEANGTLSVASANMTVFRIGFFAAVTGEVFFDDLILGDASGDYPFGIGSVERMKPTRDGSHSFTAGDFGYDTAGADIATSATDVWDKLNDDDLSSTADLIRQKVIRTTGYLEVGFGAAPFSWDALAVNVVSSYHAAGTGADTFGLKMNDGGTLKTLTNEAGTGLSDVSQTTIVFAEKVLTTAPSGGAWTAAKLGAVLVRGGYSDDVNAIPYWDGLMLEVAYGPPLLVPTTASLTLTTFAPTIAHRINGASPTAVALTTFAPTITTGAPVTVTPTTASLSTATFAPVLKTAIVGASPSALALTTFAPTIAHQITGASPTALALTTFAPVLRAAIIGASPTELSLTTFAPTVTATANQTVTPSTASLTTTGFVPVLNETVTPGRVPGPFVSLNISTPPPTVTVSDNQLVTPVTGWLTIAVVEPVVALAVVGASPTALTTATFAPVLKTAIVGATPTALVLTAFAPTVTASDHQTVTPTTASLVTTAFAPAVTSSDHQTATPTTLAVSLATFAPTASATAHQTATPDTASLSLTTFAPTVTASDHKLVTPDPVALSLTTFAPAAVAGGNQTAVPATASLTIASFAGTVTASDHQRVTPTTLATTTATFAPTVTASAHQRAVPATAGLGLTTFAPTVTASAHRVVVPGTRALTLTPHAPTLRHRVEIPAASLVISTFAATVSLSDNQLVTPGFVTLATATFAPSADLGGSPIATPQTGVLLLTGYAPHIRYQPWGGLIYVTPTVGVGGAVAQAAGLGGSISRGASLRGAVSQPAGMGGTTSRNGQLGGSIEVVDTE